MSLELAEDLGGPNRRWAEIVLVCFNAVQIQKIRTDWLGCYVARSMQLIMLPA
jgi:hypothetical protein